MNDASNLLDRKLARPMFWVSIAFLVLLGIVLHVRLEVGSQIVSASLSALAVIYPAFVLEFAARWRDGERRWRQFALYCLIPPLRIGARDQQTGDHVWLPRWGWCRIGRPLRDKVRRAFSGPMIAIACLILPVLACEFFWRQVIDQRPLLALLLDISTAIIWIAFALEFVIMLSIVNAKVRYCKENWIDLAIVCLPLLAAARLLRLGSLGRAFRAARIYRLRGVFMRAYRGLLALEVIYRLGVVKPAARLRRLKRELSEKEEEIAELRQTIERLESQMARDSQDQATVPIEDAVKPAS